jgi:hypothetical protein
MRKLALLAFSMLAVGPAYGQTAQPIFPGAQTAGSSTTGTGGQTVFVPWMACTDATNVRISCGGGGGGSTPTGTAGTPNANVVTVQGITNGTPQRVNGVASPSTNISGTTSATAGTYTTALAASTTRLGCFLQNTSAGTMYVFVGSGQASIATSHPIGPGGTFSCASGNTILSDALQVANSAASAAYVGEAQ